MAPHWIIFSGLVFVFIVFAVGGFITAARMDKELKEEYGSHIFD